MKPAFVYPQTGDQKKILCVRVDGASDEGPSHQEIQYWKCLENLQMERLSTLVTAHSSGLSYLKSQTPKWMHDKGSFKSLHPYDCGWKLH